jgi:type IV fimbrial biogenesis protein FimT
MRVTNIPSPGFTLLELLLAISISFILLMAAVPAYQHLLARNKTATVISQILTAIHTARAAAIAQGDSVILCGSGSGVDCDGQWHAGQLILSAGAQQPLRVFAGVAQGDRFWWQSSLGYNDALILTASGFTQGQRGSFYYCPAYKPSRYGARIVVSDSGRARVETDSQTLQQICT